MEIRFPENALKRDLWEIVKQSKTSPKYATDEIAKDNGVCCANSITGE